ncbi:hypothetical protein KY359_03650 [Candidatus Woesearchaeota archaeon]|nr:hypothetical protein [Candidatus Woesearchaeota archaeon]
MDKKSMGIKGGLAALVAAAALTFGGCHVQRPYAYSTFHIPAQPAQAEQHYIVLPPVHTPVYIPAPAECHTFAATAADSMQPDGHTVTTCTCQPTGNPHDAYTCGIGFR